MMATGRIDINTATADDFEQLIGIGRQRAEAIVKHRKAVGGFRFVKDLSEVSGVGKSVLDLNRRKLCCSAPKRTIRKKHHNGKALQPQQVTGTKATPTAVRGVSGPAHNLRYSRERRRYSKNVSNVKHKVSQQRHESQTEASHSLSKREDTSSCSQNLVQPSTSEEPSKKASLKCSLGSNNHEDSDSESDNEGQEPELLHDELVEDSSEGTQHGAQGAEQGRMEESEEDDDSTSDVSASDSMSNLSTPRSRIPVPLSKVFSKQLMKRKGHSLKEELSLPTKRVCRSDLPSPQTTYSNLKGPFRKGIHVYHRQRIPSKENPPSGLADWLKQFQDWGNAERLMAIDELISLCEPTQVRHMMQVIEPQFQRDFISLLPKELALYVLSFLEPKDLLQAAQTCRYWRVLAEDNLLWREKCREDNIDEALVFGTNRQRRRQLSPKSPWKALFMRQHQIEQNWRCRPIRPPKVLKGHDDHVITCLEFCGSRVVSGSDDNTLKVWSAINGKCLRTLVGHTGGVWSSQMQGNTIISGSTDRTLKVWNADTGQCIHTLYGHTSTVRCMHLNDSKVVSGSRDATLRVWNIDTGQCLHVLMGHVAAVRCVQYDGRRVVSGAYDYMVKVWDPETETCLHTLQGHTNRVYSLQFDGVHIVSGSLDTSIRVWDVETGNCLHTLIGHQSLTSGLELKDNILVSGNADSTVKVWDITTGQCLQTLQGSNKHQSAVTCLQFNKKMVITSSDDGTVKIWDLKSGDFLRNLVSLDSGGSGGVVWRVRCNNTKLVCAVGSRNGTEETKLLVLDFDVEDKKEIGLGKEKLPMIDR